MSDPIIVNGTEGDDDLSGPRPAPGPVMINGFGGNDILRGDFYGDILNGGDGNDILRTGGGGDQVFGGDGDDQIYDPGTRFVTDTFLFDGGAGNDYIVMTAADFVREPNDVGSVRTAMGGTGADTILDLVLDLGGRPKLTIDGGDGDDYIVVGPTANRTVTLGSGADVLALREPYANILNRIVVTDFLVGVDTLSFDIRPYLFLGTFLPDGTNVFTSGYLRLVASGNDTILQIDKDGPATESTYVDWVVFQNVALSTFDQQSLGGMRIDGSGTTSITLGGTVFGDRLYGGLGNDVIDGGAGDDTLFGNDGNDVLRGGDGADAIDAGTGDDEVHGGSGDDVLTDIGGVGEFYGGDGNDVFGIGLAGTGTIYLDGGAGNDTFNVFNGNPTNVNPSAIIIGGDGNDIIRMSGFATGNVIDAGGGDDKIILAAPGVTVTLGTGADEIGFVDNYLPNPGQRIITDYQPGVDRLLLPYTAPPPFQFLLGWNGTDNPFDKGYLRLVQLGSDVSFQVDRDGGGNDYVEWLRFANIAGGDFVASDFGGFTPSAPVIGAIVGTQNADNLVGSSFGEEIVALGGDDVIEGRGGDDQIDGGAGLDTAVFSDVSTAYTLLNLGGGQIRVSGPDGTDSLRGVERLQFADSLFLVPTSLLDSSPSLVLTAFGAGASAGGWTNANLYPRLVADVNGDGLADLVGFGDGGVQIALATGDGFANPFVALEAFGAGARAGAWTNDNLYPRTAADVNGDGLADLVGFGDGGVQVALATGGGAFSNPFVAISTFGAGAGAGSWTSNDLYPRTLADVNGDGMADVVGFGDGGVLIALALGGGAFANPFLALSAFGAGASAGGWTSNNLYPRMAADVNGDGMADLIGFGDGGVQVALATGGGSFASPLLVLGTFGAGASAGGWSSNGIFPRMAADVNGDGRADLIGFGDGGVYIAVANESGGFGPARLDITTFGAGAAAGSWTSNSLYPRLFGDVNGDEKADIIAFGDGGVYVAEALSASTFSAPMRGLDGSDGYGLSAMEALGLAALDVPSLRHHDWLGVDVAPL